MICIISISIHKIQFITSQYLILLIISKINDSNYTFSLLSKRIRPISHMSPNSIGQYSIDWDLSTVEGFHHILFYCVIVFTTMSIWNVCLLYSMNYS